MRAASKSRGVAKIPVRPALWFCACNLLAAALTAQCPNVSQVPNQTISSGTACYSSNNALTATGVVINGSASVTFVAGNSIELGPGFRATAGTAGTTFHAWVETAPADVSFSPLSGSGLNPIQPFTWTVSSPSGYSNLSDVYALFNTTSGSSANACYIRYNRASNLLSLADNSGLTWLGGFSPGSANRSAANSYCTIYGSGSSFSTSGTQLAVAVSVTFQTSFSGTKNEYLIGYDNEGLNTTWQQFGTWTVPAPQQYYLTTAVSPSVGGTISPASGWYNSGSVQISASAASGYQFSGFTGSVNSGSNPLTVTMNSAMTETANFTQIVTYYPLTTTVTPAGGGTVSPACPGGCSYSRGSQVTITATPSSGYQFNGFTGTVNSGSNPLTVTMNGTTTETANFTLQPATLTIVTQSLPSGTVHVAYPQTTLIASGGVPPYTWSVTSGSLPPGLNLSSSGVLSGTPTTSNANAYAFSLGVADSASHSASQPFAVTIASGAIMTMFPAYPASGSYSIQPFLFTVSDPVAATNISSITIAFKSATGSPVSGTCTWTYNPATNALSYTEAQSSGGPYYPGTSTGTIGGPLCSTNLDLSASTVSGTDVNLQLTVYFATNFNTNAFLSAQTSTGPAGPTQVGQWSSGSTAGTFQCTPPQNIPHITDQGNP
jgi:hypothetical protein